MINIYKTEKEFTVGHYECTDEEAMILESNLTDWDKLQKLDELGDGFEIVEDNKITVITPEAIKIAMKVLMALEDAEYKAEEKF